MYTILEDICHYLNLNVFIKRLLCKILFQKIPPYFFLLIWSALLVQIRVWLILIYEQLNSYVIIILKKIIFGYFLFFKLEISKVIIPTCCRPPSVPFPTNVCLKSTQSILSNSKFWSVKTEFSLVLKKEKLFFLPIYNRSALYISKRR